MYNLIGKSATRQVGFIIIEVVYYKNSDGKKKLNTLRNRGNGRTDGGGDEEIQVVRVTQQWPRTGGWKGRGGVTSSYIARFPPIIPRGANGRQNATDRR